MKEQSFDEVAMTAKRAGYLFFPYHTYVDAKGKTYEGREEEAVASGEFTNNEVSYTILVDAISKEKSSPVQLEAVEKLRQKYPLAVLKEYEGELENGKILQS